MNADKNIDFDGNNYPLKELTEKVIGAAFAVSNELGCGFLEKVYENAMVLELRHIGLTVARQLPVKIQY